MKKEKRNKLIGIKRMKMKWLSELASFLFALFFF